MTAGRSKCNQKRLHFSIIKKKVRCITIKNIYFEDIEELACDMADSYDSVKDNEDETDVAVIAKYAEMREIIKELSCIGYTIHSCQLEDEEYDGYDAEFICTIYDGELWIEKMLREKGYITDESAVIYLLDNCNSKVISNVKSKNIYEVSLNDDNECNCGDCDCKHTELSKDSDGETHGFTQSWTDDNGSYYSKSFYSSDIDLVKEMLKNW